MPDDVFLHNGKPTIRSAFLTGLLFEVLANVREPIRAAEAVRRVDERLDPTPHEASKNKSGIRRWETYIRWVTSWAKTIGWIEKGKGYWSLTPAGRAAMDERPREELDAEITRRYQATRKPEPSDQTSSQTLLGQALDLLGPGQWTTYGDLAQLTGLANQGISQSMRCLGHDAAHRVLQADGTHQAEALSASDVVTLTPAYTANAWTIAPGRWVGVARVSDVEVWVRPKLPVRRLLFLLGYAYDVRSWRDGQVEVTEGEELLRPSPPLSPGRPERRLSRAYCSDTASPRTPRPCFAAGSAPTSNSAAGSGCPSRWRSGSTTTPPTSPRTASCVPRRNDCCASRAFPFPRGAPCYGSCGS